MAISKIDRKEIIKRTIQALPNNPSASGYSAETIKQYMYQAIAGIDENDISPNLAKEINGIVDEIQELINSIQEDITKHNGLLYTYGNSITKNGSDIAKNSTEIEKVRTELRNKWNLTESEIADLFAYMQSDVSRTNQLTTKSYVESAKNDAVSQANQNFNNNIGKGTLTLIINGKSYSWSSNTNENLSLIFNTLNVDLSAYATKAELNEIADALPKFEIKVVEELPTEDINPTCIYLIVNGEESPNVYDEFIYVNGAWEKIGTQTLDLSDYATKDYVAQNGGKIDKIFVNGEEQEIVDKKVEITIPDGSKIDEIQINGQTLPIGADKKVNIPTVRPTTLPTKQVMKIAIDDEPTENSNNLIRSKGVADMKWKVAYEDSTTSVTLEDNKSIRMNNTISTLNINTPSTMKADFMCELVFGFNGTDSGLVYDKIWQFTGTDCDNSIFVPNANKVYNILFFNNGTDSMGSYQAVVRGV